MCKDTSDPKSVISAWFLCNEFINLGNVKNNSFFSLTTKRMERFWKISIQVWKPSRLRSRTLSLGSSTFSPPMRDGCPSRAPTHINKYYYSLEIETASSDQIINFFRKSWFGKRVKNVGKRKILLHNKIRDHDEKFFGEDGEH